MTTPATVFCGIDCNKTVIITASSPDEITTWNSHNYDVSNYPDDCTCTLTVKVNYKTKT